MDSRYNNLVCFGLDGFMTKHATKYVTLEHKTRLKCLVLVYDFEINASSES